jgi:predicted MFS family arabinose efflux permease
MFLVFIGLYFAFFYVSAFSKSQLGFSQTDAFTVLIIMNAVGLPGRVIPNYLADRMFGPINLLVPFAIAVGMLMLCWTQVHTHAGLLTWACFYGICGAGIQSLFPATLSSLTSDLSKSGTRYDFFFFFPSYTLPHACMCVWALWADNRVCVQVWEWSSRSLASLA